MVRKFLTAIELPADPSTTLQAATKGYVDTAASGRVPTTRSVIAGTGLSGGGSLSADVTLAVAYGTTSGTAAQGNDSRFSNAAQKLTPTASKTAAYTAVNGDYVLSDATSGSFNVTLPAASAGLVIGVKKTDSSVNTVTVVPNGTDTFQGGVTSNPVLRLQDESRTLIGITGGWVAVENINTLSSLDTRYAPLASPTFTGLVTVSRIVESPVSLTDAATIATNAALGNYFRVTLGGSRTLGNPTNPTDGQRILWEITQDATGGRTLTLDTAFALGSDITVVTLSLTANKRDFLGAVYNAAAGKWYVIAMARGY